MDSTTALKMVTTKHLIIHGRVQGVSFRASMSHETAKLEITGWVRNRVDGSVEAMLQGEATALKQLIAWAHRGPPGASVSRVEVTDGQGIYKKFSIRPAAY